MQIHTAQSTIPVDVADAEGYNSLGRTVIINIEYMQTITQGYGEDADGRRGDPVVEYDLLDVSLDLATLRTLTIHQAEQVLADARAIFHERNRRTARRA